MDIIRKFYFIYVVCFLTTSTSVFSGNKIPTINEYLNDKTDNYDSYIYGLESGLEWAAEYYYRKHQVEIYCKPADIILPVSKLRSMIDKTIQSKPGFFEKYKDEPLLGLALRNGYIESFPCQ